MTDNYVKLTVYSDIDVSDDDSLPRRGTRDTETAATEYVTSWIWPCQTGKHGSVNAALDRALVKSRKLEKTHGVGAYQIQVATYRQPPWRKLPVIGQFRESHLRVVE